MTRTWVLAAGFALAPPALVSADEKPGAAKKADPDLVVGHVADGSLVKKAPDLGAVINQKEFDNLVKAWQIEKPFKVDFARQFVVVATTQGSGIELSTAVKDGNLAVKVLGTADLKPGFRYALRRVDRAGITTINGKPIPKE
jgi:hypothetical protein